MKTKTIIIHIIIEDDFPTATRKIIISESIFYCFLHENVAQNIMIFITFANLCDILLIYKRVVFNDKCIS